MKIITKIILKIAIILLISSCNKGTIFSKIDENEINQNKLNQKQNELINEYQKVAIDTENLKWKKEIRLFLDGNITKEYKENIQKIIGNYNKLFSDGMNIKIVNDFENANVHLLITNKKNVGKTWKDIPRYITDQNTKGYATTTWKQENPQNEKIITKGRIWIENTNIELTYHEIGHLLGLEHSSLKYCPKSVMCAVTTANELSDFDKAIIKIKYHQKIKSGDDFNKIKPIILELLQNKEIQL
ncbi:DUF2927 domain-containing protein [Tenacibaculum piscium]|uniref:DUF2927 domain-containing protein n=2 Tax=Tenacibaculum piscium TaxID=1458515 RepID=UPI001EFBEC9A|nr:DUF2927 domain-containing protein [Tenacibaculum piscium]MCG8183689.1 DUF2927 domain-containing protein [Tenacibaculum piscium]MCG8204824.1 DUF2927 domain-containing protein [Tenacibaculum piscium]